MLTRIRTVAAFSLAVVSVASCASSSVPLLVPTPTPQVASACGSLMAQVPPQLFDQSPRATTPRSTLTKAWGNPALTVRCGVDRPATLRATSELVEISGTDWFAEEVTGATVLTARIPRGPGQIMWLELVVPARYGPAAQVATELVPAVNTAATAS